jgi:hypothetical protein
MPLTPIALFNLVSMLPDRGFRGARGIDVRFIDRRLIVEFDRCDDKIFLLQQFKENLQACSITRSGASDRALNSR